MKTFTTSSGTKINVKNGDEVFHSILISPIAERQQWLAKFPDKFSDAEANIIERSILENWKRVEPKKLRKISGQYAFLAFKQQATKERIKAECAASGLEVTVQIGNNSKHRDDLRDLISYGR